MRSSRLPSDNPRSLDRRALLGVPVLLVGAIASAQAAPLRRVSVDVALEGVGAIAAHVRRTLPHYLARELAENPLEGYSPGARLVIRVTEVYLSAGLEQYGGLGNADALDGEALILDAAGRVLLRKSVAGRAQPETDVVSAPYGEPRRVENLISSFAYWTVRALQ